MPQKRTHSPQLGLKPALRKLLQWFSSEKKDLPWRHDRTPYSVWISEIMLQQTVVSTVIPYFTKWMKKFPGIKQLARAPEREAMVLWEGLGYYSRCRNILLASRLITKKFRGKIPDHYEDLRSLPGIGDYTASAILSLAFRKPYPVMDANVKRIVQRLLALKNPDKKEEERTRSFLRKMLPVKQPGEFNEAMMELGQRICLPENPFCSRCPLKGRCLSFKSNLQNKIPQRKTSGIIGKRTRLLILCHGEKVLITQKQKGVLKGLWLFPAIPMKQACEDLIKKRIAKEFEQTAVLKPVSHHYTKYRDRLYPVMYKVSALHAAVDKEGKWVDRTALRRFPMPSAYRKIAALLSRP
ncbi:MAG: A/G-specific adenine glycosylase [bacterium]|nr:A/G-specific adenine glycosylase [bacterium]